MTNFGKLVLFTAIAKAAATGGRRVPGDGDGDGIPNEGGKKGMPTAPKLAGPKAQAAISALTAAAKSGKWRSVDAVDLPMGIHPQVRAYKDAILEHMGAKDKALGEAIGSPRGKA